MTEMVERATQAIETFMHTQLRATPSDFVRIVFAEIRFPTREMLEAADAAGSDLSPALPHEVWPAMIDAAIGKVSD